MNKRCKYYKTCPIYSGILKSMEITSTIYKTKYCEISKEGWELCKRYQIKEATGKCPPNLLPNARKNVDALIAIYNIKR